MHRRTPQPIGLGCARGAQPGEIQPRCRQCGPATTVADPQAGATALMVWRRRLGYTPYSHCFSCADLIFLLCDGDRGRAFLQTHELRPGNLMVIAIYDTADRRLWGRARDRAHVAGDQGQRRYRRGTPSVSPRRPPPRPEGGAASGHRSHSPIPTHYAVGSTGRGACKTRGAMVRLFTARKQGH